ncbi:MAG: hypothetical protein EXX96DRAFT_648970 [Benjaminiella poitrasii]|nr:MAG: hypothetical protein EXX96DRAFT_648970 [Benjaminiella poitrasii]
MSPHPRIAGISNNNVPGDRWFGQSSTLLVLHKALIDKDPLWQHHVQGAIPIPRSVPHGYYPCKAWSLFWRLLLTNKAVTPWWRLLKDSIICSSANESCVHLFLYCPVKWSFWQQAIQQLNLATFFSANDIWTALSTLHDFQGRLYPADVLATMGIILEAV